MSTHILTTNPFSLVDRLSNQQLVAQVKQLAHDERQATASLIAHLAVLDKRGLYRGEGCSSTFTYCLEVLHLSEHAAFGRITAARAARKYPIILELLTKGSVNLTTVTMLAPHLKPENHSALLEAARYKRKRQVQELIAVLRPQPPVPSSIRRLPAPHRAPATLEASPPIPTLEAPVLTLETPALTQEAPAPGRRSLRRLHPEVTGSSSRRAHRRMRSCGWHKSSCVTRSPAGMLGKSSIAP